MVALTWERAAALCIVQPKHTPWPAEGQKHPAPEHCSQAMHAMGHVREGWWRLRCLACRG